VLAAMLAGANAQFAYNNRDLVLAFSSTSGTDLEVNIGSVSNYVNRALNNPGSVMTVPSYTKFQFQQAMASNSVGVRWSVSGGVAVGVGDTVHPARTVWLTKPRTDNSTRRRPSRAPRRPRRVPGQQHPQHRGCRRHFRRGPVERRQPGGCDDEQQHVHHHPILRSEFLYGDRRTAGNLHGNFGEGTIENSSDVAFTVEVSDLYEINPNAAGGNATYIGSFSLKSDGTMTFQAGDLHEPAIVTTWPARSTMRAPRRPSAWRPAAPAR